MDLGPVDRSQLHLLRCREARVLHLLLARDLLRVLAAQEPDSGRFTQLRRRHRACRDFEALVAGLVVDRELSTITVQKFEIGQVFVLPIEWIVLLDRHLG